MWTAISCENQTAIAGNLSVTLPATQWVMQHGGQGWELIIRLKFNLSNVKLNLICITMIHRLPKRRTIPIKCKSRHVRRFPTFWGGIDKLNRFLNVGSRSLKRFIRIYSLLLHKRFISAWCLIFLTHQLKASIKLNILQLIRWLQAGDEHWTWFEKIFHSLHVPLRQSKRFRNTSAVQLSCSV